VNEATLRDRKCRVALCFLALGHAQEGTMTGEAPAAVHTGRGTAREQPVVATLARAAWLAILLGLPVQILALVAKIAAGRQSNHLQLIVAVESGVQ